MDQSELILDKNIGGIPFFKFPYLDLSIAVFPLMAIGSLWEIWNKVIIDVVSATEVLCLLIDHGDQAGLKVLICGNYEIGSPEEKVLSAAIYGMNITDGIYAPQCYLSSFSKAKLDGLFGL